MIPTNVDEGNRLLTEAQADEPELDYPPAARNGDFIANGKPAESDKTRAPMFTAMDGAELAAAKFSTDYLIPGLLVAQQPGLLCGGKKSLKTTIAVDLAISLSIGPAADTEFGGGRGAHFLGYWPVARKCRVALMSGESGMGTLQETAVRIASAAGRHLADLDYFLVTDKLPQFGNIEHLIGIERFIVDYGVEVLIIDPAYLAIPTDGAEGSLFKMGQLLLSISEICTVNRVTLLLLHHTKKNPTNPHDPPELEQIAWSGFQEWARQWMLLGRRSTYEPGTGHHELWLTAGGSAGHSGLWGVDIDEGEYHPDVPRKWEVAVLPVRDVRKQATDKKHEAKQQEQAAHLEADRTLIVRLLVKLDRPATKTTIKEYSHLNTPRLNGALESLMADDTLAEFDVLLGNRQTHAGFGLKERVSKITADLPEVSKPKRKRSARKKAKQPDTRTHPDSPGQIVVCPVV